MELSFGFYPYALCLQLYLMLPFESLFLLLLPLGLIFPILNILLLLFSELFYRLWGPFAQAHLVKSLIELIFFHLLVAFSEF